MGRRSLGIQLPQRFQATLGKNAIRTFKTRYLSVE
jgi:hypothetical protein